MPVKSAAVKTVDQVLDMDMSVEGMNTRPSRIRQWFTNNIIRRMFAYPIVWDGVHFKLQKSTTDGVIEVAEVGGGFNSAGVVRGNAPNSWGLFTFAGLTVTYIEFTTWDYPVYIKISMDGVHWGGYRELVADMVYTFNFNCKAFQLQNIVSGELCRFEAVGFLKTV